MEIFLEKIQNLLNWKKDKTPKQDVDYEFYHIKDSTLTGIRLLKSPYRGITYYYGVVKMTELGDIAQMQFDYRILEPGTHTTEGLQKDSDFVKLIGDILTELIITEQAKNGQTREGDFEEPHIF